MSPPDLTIESSTQEFICLAMIVVVPSLLLIQTCDFALNFLMIIFQRLPSKPYQKNRENLNSLGFTFFGGKG